MSLFFPLIPVILYFTAAPANRPDPVSYKYLPLLESHFTRLIREGTDQYGSVKSPVWMSSLDPSTGRYPENDQRPEHIPSRVYLNRSVDAPRGASLYWDLPALAAARQLSSVTGNNSYWEAADRYLDFYSSTCKAGNEILLWGNHYYYQVYDDQCVKFQSGEIPQPVDPDTETGDLHEIRPFSPPWEILWEMDAALTEKHIREAMRYHLVDFSTGEFNRHADGRTGYAFLEAGGILAYTLAWLYDKTLDSSLLEMANRIITYSYTHRNKQTGLVENCPTKDRWDKYSCTSEIGLWAGYLLKARELAPENFRGPWLKMVDGALSSWLEQAWDAGSNKYYGGLKVAEGTPFQPEPDYPYQPGKYADIWNPLFPTHDYPMQLAEATLKLYTITGKRIYKVASQRWLKHIREQVIRRQPDRLLYAENYARIIHFLMKYQENFKSRKNRQLIDQLIREAIDQLFLPQFHFFRSHTGENRYDAVDGIGLLSLVLIWHETGKESDYDHYFF